MQVNACTLTVTAAEHEFPACPEELYGVMVQDCDATGNTFSDPDATGESDPPPISPVQEYVADAAFVVLHEAWLLCPALIFAGVNLKLHDA